MSRITSRSMIEQRARILAMVQFTSRNDLHVSDFPEDAGLDLLVRIVSDAPGYQKFFGVKLRGTNISLHDPGRATEFLGNSNYAWAFEGNIPAKFSFPVAVLLFSMQDDNGYFAWYIEPFVNRAGQPKLRLNKAPKCEAFDRSTLGGIVDRVSEWHARLVTLLEMA